MPTPEASTDQFARILGRGRGARPGAEGGGADTDARLLAADPGLELGAGLAFLRRLGADQGSELRQALAALLARASASAVADEDLVTRLERMAIIERSSELALYALGREQSGLVLHLWRPNRRNHGQLRYSPDYGGRGRPSRALCGERPGKVATRATRGHWATRPELRCPDCERELARAATLERLIEAERSPLEPLPAALAAAWLAAIEDWALGRLSGARCKLSEARLVEQAELEARELLPALAARYASSDQRAYCRRLLDRGRWVSGTPRWRFFADCWLDHGIRRPWRLLDAELVESWLRLDEQVPFEAGKLDVGFWLFGKEITRNGKRGVWRALLRFVPAPLLVWQALRSV